MKQQYDTGNVQKLYPTFPSLTSIQIYENPYTFFNNGPHNNILETCNHLCEQIKNVSFDAAIISAGAYSCLIADFIINNLHKEAFVIGGDLSYYFGINTTDDLPKIREVLAEQIVEGTIINPIDFQSNYNTLEGTKDEEVINIETIEPENDTHNNQLEFLN
jgi:hypothetical protein